MVWLLKMVLEEKPLRNVWEINSLTLNTRLYGLKTYFVKPIEFCLNKSISSPHKIMTWFKVKPFANGFATL